MLESKLFRGLKAFNSLICAAGIWVASAAIAMIAIIIVLQVFFRYVLNNSLSWSEDVSLMLMASSALLVMPYALRHGLHIGVEFLQEMLPPRLVSALSFVFQIAIMGLTVYAVVMSWRFAVGSSMLANALPIRMTYPYAVMPVSFALTIPVSIEIALLSLNGALRSEAHTMPPEHGGHF